MRSRIPPADVSEASTDIRREPSLARQAPAVARLGVDGASAAKPLRAGERLAVLSSSEAPADGRAGRSMLFTAGIAIVGALALVGAFTLVRFFAGL
ncbi:MAG TPA: hypothetical protein VLV50_10135 [Stellaceae bacterium]|nr:hypothetical protein [Stellaceae bacterium]